MAGSIRRGLVSMDQWEVGQEEGTLEWAITG
jgi:hypothetical protein